MFLVTQGISVAMLHTTRRLRPIDQLLADAWRLLARQWPVLVTAQGLVLALSVCLMFALVGPLLFWLIDHGIRHFPRLEHCKTFAAAWPILREVVLPAFGLMVVAIAIGVVMTAIVKAWGECVILYGLAYGTSRRAEACATALRGVSMAMPLFWITLFVSGIVAGGLFWCIVPGFILAIGLSQALYIRVLEGVSIDAALRQSWVRTRGHRWAILGRYLFLVLCTFGLLFAAGILQILPVVGLISLPIQLVVQFGLPVLYLLVGYLLYLDLRPRPGDGLDAATAPTGWFGFFAISACCAVAGVVTLLLYAVVHSA